MKSNFIIGSVFFSAFSQAMAEPNFTPYEQTELVMAHNHLRSIENVPALQWSSALADAAQGYADTLKKAKACKPVHSRSTELGENLFWASPVFFSDGVSAVQALTPTQVIDAWGSEKADYSYLDNTCATGKVCGHYTQIVWKSTAEVGCGKAVCPDYSQVWVCDYKPAGNFIGHKPY